MESRPLGIGVIGAGAILKRHALAYRGLPHLAKLVGIADLEEKRARAAKEAFKFEEAVTDYAKLLSREDIQVIDVAAPAGAHKRMVLDALAAGKHVICEKPLATTLADADAIVEAAERYGANGSPHPRPLSQGERGDGSPRHGEPDGGTSGATPPGPPLARGGEGGGRTVSCIFQLRCDPVHRRTRWMIEQGEIGRPLLARLAVRVKKSPAYYSHRPGSGSWKVDGGGVLINQAIHQLDALISFLGEPREVSASMDTFVHPIEAEDSITGWVRFESGALATIECTTCAKKKEFLIDVVGEAAQMRITGDPDSQVFDWKVDAAGSAARKAVIATGLKAVPQPKKQGGLGERAGKIAAKIGRKPWIPPPTFGHAPFIREFLEAARDGRPGPVPPAEARRSLALAVALYESAKTGRVVRFPVDERNESYRGFEAERELAAVS